MARIRKDTKVRSPGAAARRMQVVPYLAQKMPMDMIAKLFKVSETTIRKWAMHPDVRDALGEVSSAVVEATKVTAEQLVTKAFAALDELVAHAEDERVRLEAAKTIADRFGYPATSRSEQKQENLTPPVQIMIAADRALAIARESGGGDNE